MAGDLDFSVQLRVLNEQFNNGINQARDKFTQYAQSVQRNVQQMNTDTERASTMLAGLANVDSSRLTSELRATADQLRQMGAGANLSGEQVAAAMEASALQVTRLGRQLEVARSEALRLSQTNASPADIEQAAANVNRLEQELNSARSASVSLANELSGAMNRASTTADNARNSLYRMANIRVPETIRGEIDSISRALVDFQRNSGRPAAEIERATRAAEEQIRRLENELNGLDDTQDRVNQGSQRFTGGINGVRNAMGSLQGMLAAAGLGIGIAEIIEVSDAFKTLEARVKLATGEGAAFVTGFEGVKQIANETFSSIESTGELFARISQAGEELGLAQAQVLSVTRTINEAIKLSGGSAASADAAITQLIQGLQSGVVRGEEFNSIMEQAPRLAKAMADGLGVTRGELRAMAQDGVLTSEVVIQAVQSQGEAIASEFGTLPTTVGNALQEAKNKLFVFIGDMDKTVNQSSILAEAISQIGDSLDNLDPATTAALNQTFSQLIETVSLFWRRIVDTYKDVNNLINAIAGGATDANEQVGLITASLSGVSIFIGAINDGIKGIEITARVVESVISTWAAVAARFTAYLTFGETKAALLDLANSLDEHAVGAMEKADQAAQNFSSSFAAAMEDAAKTSTVRLGEAAQAAADTYDKMKLDGTVAAEAVEGAFTKMANAQIAAYGEAALGALQAEAAERNLTVAIGETGKAIVSKMTDEQAASASAQGAAKALDKTYRELADSLSVGITQGYADAKASVLELSDSFDVLTDAGYQTGEVLFAALNDMTNKAKNTTELQDIILMWEDLGKQGRLTGEDLAAGLDLANERLDALTDGVNSVNEAYKVLGLTTRAEAAKQAEAYTQAYGIIVKDGEATAGQLIDGFQKYAKASIAANGDVVSSQLKVEAAQRGLTVAVDKTGRVTFKSMADTETANTRVTRSVNNIRTAYDGISSSAGSAGQAMVNAANQAASAYDKLQKKIKAAKEAMEVKNADETLKNLRVYGTEKAPVEGNQFGSKTAVENFLKSSGLSVERAAEEARKLYAKQGTNGGALNAGALQGIRDGQMMTTQQLANFKTASILLLEVAEKAKADEARRSKYESKLNRSDDSSNNNQNNNQSNNVDNNPVKSVTLNKDNAAQLGFGWDDKTGKSFSNEFTEAMGDIYKIAENNRNNGWGESDVQAKFDRMVASLEAKYPQPQQSALPQSTLDAIANLSKQPSYANIGNSGGPVKTIKLDLSFNGNGVSTEMPADQEAMLMTLVKALQDSKALSGQ
ncbi:MAG: tape measure protein [Psychrobacter sp.]